MVTLVLGGSAVGEYASRPLKAGDAAQPRGCSARFVLLVSGRWGDPVHGLRDLVYGTGFQDSAVHGLRDLVYSLLSEKATLS